MPTKKRECEKVKIKKELLQAYLDKEQITSEILARDMGVSIAELDKLLNGEAVIEATARQFIHYFGADEAAQLIDWTAIGKENPFEDEG